MNTRKDPFEWVAGAGEADLFEALQQKAVSRPPTSHSLPSASVARFYGFGADEGPLVTGVPGLPGEVVPARAAVPLQRSQIGSEVVLVFADGDARRPIVMGVLQDGRRPADPPAASGDLVSVRADDDRFVVSAEREIVLRCGDASITLTRAGKVLIKGTYVLSRSSGYNKIKGAAIDIN